MRGVTWMVAGIVAAVGLSVVSASTSGFVGAGAFLLAHFITLVLAAVVVVAAVNVVGDRPMREVPNRSFTGRCHECGRPLLQMSWVWFCAVCDRAPAFHLPHLGFHR